MASASSSTAAPAASPLASIITQVPQSGPAFASSAAARPVKVKKKKQQQQQQQQDGAATRTTTAATPTAISTVATTPAATAVNPAAPPNATSATTTPLTPAEAAAQAAANMQAKQQAQQQQHAQAPPRTTSKQQRKPSTTVPKSPSATATTAAPANAAAATPAAPATTSPAAPAAAAPATTQHAQNTTTSNTTTTTEKLSPAQAAARAKSSANAQNKPKFMRRIIAIITCSSPTHIPSPSDDSARTLSSSTTTAAGGKKSYEAGTASTLDKPATTTATAAAQNGTAGTDKETSEKSGLKPPPGPLSIQTPSTPIKSSSLTVPTSNGPASPSPSTSSSAILTGPNAPPSPSPSAIAGGTRLPREETGDVTSGAVVPPGASYVAQGGAGPGNMFRLASAVDGVPSLGIIAAVAGTGGAAEDGLPTTAPHQALLATPEPATAATATLVETEDEDEEDDEEEDEDEEDGQHEGVHMDEDEYEMSEEALEEQRLIAQGGIGIPIDEDGNPHPLLSPIIDKDEGRKCLVLDLDETLVHSSFKMIQNADFIVPVEIEGNFHNVYVIKRPGVDEFMRRMGELYEVVVFTASLSKYADPVLDMLDIHRVVRHRLFRESCFNHKGNYVKDLSQLGREIGETLILDNSPASYIFHPNNAVPISSWFNDPHDTELVDLCEFLRDLSVVDDVRTVLDGAL